MSTPVSLAVEGLLDEKVLRKLLEQVAHESLAPGACYVQNGREQLRQNTPRFNQAARFKPFVILADLDRDHCAPQVVQTWLPEGRHPNLALRIAVRMIESWLLADRHVCAEFLGISERWLPHVPDAEDDPKLILVNLARRSRLRDIRDDIVPAVGSTSRVGKNYVGQLTRFINTKWNAQRAGRQSASLDRAIRALQVFAPSVSRH